MNFLSNLLPSGITSSGPSSFIGGLVAVIQVKFSSSALVIQPFSSDSSSVSLSSMAASASGVDQEREQQSVERKRLTKMVFFEGGGKEELSVFDGLEDIEGEVVITPQGSKLDHFGIKIELIGQIGMF
jgi:hypothetical protein